MRVRGRTFAILVLMVDIVWWDCPNCTDWIVIKNDGMASLYENDELNGRYSPETVIGEQRDVFILTVTE